MSVHTTNTFAAREHQAGRRPDPSTRDSATIGGVRYQKVTYTDRAEPLSGVTGWANRLGRGAAGVVGTVATLGMANFSSEFRDATWRTATKGRVENDVYYDGVDPLEAERTAPPLREDSDAPNRLVERLGYDPHDRASIRAYLERPEIRSQLVESNGNYMLPEHRRDGTSSFLFVPNGDFTKATSLKMSHAKSGEALKGAEFHRAMHTYSSQYQDMVEGTGKALDDMAVSLGKKLGLDSDQIERRKEQLKERAKRGIRSVVLDHARGHTRLYGHVDPNKRGMLGSAFGGAITRGTRIDWSKGTTKDVKEIHKASPDNKLSTNKPFTAPPPAPAADRRDRDEEDLLH